MSEIEALYREKIEPGLAQLETQRKQLRNGYLLFTIGLISSFALIALLFITKMWAIAIPLAALIVFNILKIIKVNQQKSEYRIDFKGSVVAKIVRGINPDWIYEPDARIDPMVYWQSDLFRTRYDRYKGDDLVKGVIDKTDFECSELHTEYKEVTHDSKGRRQERWVTIFRGLFFHADFNKEFLGRTYVTPDVAQKIFGKFGQKLQSFTGPAPLIKLENIEFEKEFVVHATDQIEARYILTPAIMEAMLRIKRQYNCDVHFSFVGSRVFCALSIHKNLFEPKIFNRSVNLQEIETMHTLFKVNEVIVNELNLNTRIWTKD